MNRLLRTIFPTLSLVFRFFLKFEIRYLKLQLMVLFLFLPFELLAIGVSATPAVLNVRAPQGQEAVARFVVANPSKEVGIFDVYPEEFESSIVLTPSRFVLEAGERREVIVRAKRHDLGIVRTVLAVEAQPLGLPAQGIGGGVRLPFSYEVTEKTRLLAGVFSGSPVPLFAILNIGALTVLFLVRRVLLSTLKWLVRGSTL